MAATILSTVSTAADTAGANDRSVSRARRPGTPRRARSTVASSAAMAVRRAARPGSPGWGGSDTATASWARRTSPSGGGRFDRRRTMAMIPHMGSTYVPCPVQLTLVFRPALVMPTRLPALDAAAHGPCAS